MTSRRTVLRTGSTALLASLAGCAGGDGSSDDTTSDGGGSPEDTADSTATTDSAGDSADRSEEKPTLEAERLDPSELQDGAVVVLATPELHQLVVDAEASEGPVDLSADEPADAGTTLALGEFDYVRFQISRYEPTASFADSTAETSYEYDLETCDESDAGSDVLEYEDLSDAERAVADAMLEDGSYTVGQHENRPAAVEPFAAEGYLRTADAIYRVRETADDHAAHHMLRLDSGSPSSDDQVVTIRDRTPSPGVAESLTTAAEEGSATLQDMGPVSSYLDGTVHVVALDTVFRVRIFEPN